MLQPLIYPPAVWPPVVYLDGYELEFVELDTTELVQIVATENWLAVIPGALIEADQLHIVERLADLDDRLSFTILHKVVKLVMRNLTATSPRAAQQLAHLVVAGWFGFDAWCVMHNFDPSTAALHRVMAAAYAYVMEGVAGDKNKTMQLEARLFPPDPDDDPTQDEHAIMAKVVQSSPDGKLVT